MAGRRNATGHCNVLAAAATLASGISTAQATVINYQASGSGSDGSLVGIANFTTGASFIDVTLTRPPSDSGEGRHGRSNRLRRSASPIGEVPASSHRRGAETRWERIERLDQRLSAAG